MPSKKEPSKKMPSDNFSKNSTSNTPVNTPIYQAAKNNHGGQLKQASEQYKIPEDQWLDLSTGISPFVYPLPEVPNECWQRLPETNDGLEEAASNYYGSPFLLPVAGSQEAIQGLPKLFKQKLSVGIIKPAYHSHQKAWEDAGHEIVLIDHEMITSSPDSASNKDVIASIDILIIVNPTNPATHLYTKETLSSLHQQLSKKGGCLIIDEAFIDATPEYSLIEQTPLQGLIVLRSIGKFFGLAGIRLGFVWAEENILQALAKQQDDWSVSHPARWAGKVALADKTWQQLQRERLIPAALRLKELLSKSFSKKVPVSRGVALNTALFAYLEIETAAEIYQLLAAQGVLVRLFNESNYQNNALRFGLPATEFEWTHLEQALATLNS
ncbi:threonine-phosphate decarboxylase CobD [Cocleimonas flava]|uniref:threonine-phosphate decarboxylase n=1 Tax=Cocleimonas flava TaxID=634765 RepID=A0A4R1F435_9GAMM|nr:threonine-phosphate decarboxylase CobD [Cocleimonas flava]TCJ88573.1 L-threonine O-3-phosphate decarboxylase [Cocleimonas flava]